MAEYSNLVHAAEMALARRDGDRFAAAMDAAEASGMPRVDAMVLRLGAAGMLPMPEKVVRQLVQEYLKLAAEEVSRSADPSVHDAISVVIRVMGVCGERSALLADLGDQILGFVEQVSDDAPFTRDESGAVVETARAYKARVRESIAQARRDVGL